MELEVKKFVDSVLGLIDSDTKEAIDATFSNIVLISSDPAIFTVEDVNSDGVVDVVGVSEGTATLTVTADATYVDKNTHLEVTGNKVANVTVTITAPPPTAENTELVVTFTAPSA